MPSRVQKATHRACAFSLLGAASVVFDGGLWVLGGKVAPNVITDSVEILSEGAGEWKVRCFVCT